MARWYLLKIDEVGEETLNRLEKIREGRPPAECYFHRAKNFSPEDGLVPAIFGIYLHKRGRLDEALAEYQLAEAVIPDHAELAYNQGLLYFDLGKFEKAKQYAERAHSLGYPLTGLQKKVAEQELKPNTKTLENSSAQ